ncbi:MAG: hypothetical protein ACRD4K_01965 [Candidatus Acidiferrales bacterium]
MKPRNWWCADCRAAVALSRHGRCETCNSEALDKIDSTLSRNVPVAAAPRVSNLFTRAFNFFGSNPDTI